MFAKTCILAVRRVVYVVPKARRASGFGLFMRAMRKNPAVAKLNKSTTIGARGKLLGSMWAKLSDAERRKFAVAAKKVKFPAAKVLKARVARLQKRVAHLPASKRLGAIRKIVAARK